MGLDYVYVEDGNNVETLIQTFESVKDTQRPVVVHIHTLKGKGYTPAQTDKERWHWSMPFDIATGKLKDSSNAVFVNRIISITCTLNDRKVIA